MARYLLPGLMVSICLLLASCSNSGNSLFTEVSAVAPEPVPERETNIVLAAGDDLEQRAQEALISAQPGDSIEFPAGRFEFNDELSLSVSGVTIRGAGIEQTVLDFSNQSAGAQGILATGDNFTIEDISIENTPGDGIKVESSNGVTIRRVRVEWTGGPSTDNGAYGLYPVQSQNVLIEDTVIIGASDAGVYVGQSRNIIVRRNRAEFNVAGIEIENSTFADVYDNIATNNTGGILVFDLPNIEVQGGQSTRVYDNEVFANNTDNFAPEGNIVGQVPAGTGIMVMANDDIEIFNNTISDNQTVGITVVNYEIVSSTDDPNYDPLPERIYIHDNVFSNNSTDPKDLGLTIASAFIANGLEMPDIFYDGLGTDGPLPEAQRICIRNNGDVKSGVLLPTVLISDDYFDCAHASLPDVVLDTPEVIENGNAPLSEEEIATLCDADATGLNRDALGVDCPMLSSYALFSDATDPTQNPNDAGVPYDLISALFSDYAEKYRFVFLPDGTSAAYSERDRLDFPVGTVIAKTFAIQSDLRDPTSAEEIIETRLLIHRLDGWVGLPYVWTQDKTDAELRLAGASTMINWIHTDGSNRSTEYRVPDANDCKTCHGEDETLPIGPKVRFLNGDYEYSTGLENQLTHWQAAGILSGVPDAASFVTVPDWENAAEDLDERARAYLDINCAHCHSEEGMARTSQLYLEYWRDFDISYGRCKPPVAAGAGAGNLDYDIVPGSAADSILAFRMASNELDVRMPELGRSVVHDEAVALINEWIDAMPPVNCDL